MPRKFSEFFLHINTDPNPDSFPTVWEHRKQQARPIFSNPFIQDDAVVIDDSDLVQLPIVSRRPSGMDEAQAVEESVKPVSADTPPKNTNMDTMWGDQPPQWLSLFYDLAWTATFSNLTSNFSFVSKEQTVTYIVYFTIAWWIWVAQVFYTVDFYTDDWFHLVCIGLQFIVFGALAALTQGNFSFVFRGLKILTYITHSPGSSKWSDETLLTIEPEEYLAQQTNKRMFEWIALVIALSRLIHLAQYIVVIYWARKTSKSKQCPRQLLLVPASLFISTMLFFAAFGLTKARGDMKVPAILKLVLWALGVIVEVAAHIKRFQWNIDDKGLQLRSHGSIVGRFTGLTTIIVGEGINAIASTLFKINTAPGFKRSVILGMGASGVIIFLLVYLYFQGPSPQRPVRRRAAWAMLHWPWLLCVILLLEGVKNQLLLTNFLGSMWYLIEQTNTSIYDSASESEFNQTLATIFLKGGMRLVDQMQKLEELMTQNVTGTNLTLPSEDAQNEIYNVWHLRVLAQGVVNVYTSFMDNDTIKDNVQEDITRYMYHYDYTFQDYRSNDAYNLMNIIWGLIRPSVENSRYIMGLSGATFIILGLLNLVQSWPRDRFQWASIISRFAVGIAVSLLALMNIGRYQTYFPPDGTSDSDRAKIFGWIDKNAVLPTLAAGYVIQFIIDTFVVYFARYVSRIRLAVSDEVKKVMKSA